jgi:hypothetical protein
MINPIQFNRVSTSVNILLSRSQIKSSLFDEYIENYINYLTCSSLSSMLNKRYGAQFENVTQMNFSRNTYLSSGGLVMNFVAQLREFKKFYKPEQIGEVAILDEVVDGYSNTDYQLNESRFLEFLGLCVNLTELDLSNQDVGDDFVKSLAQRLSDSSFCPKLTKLKLLGNPKITASGLKELFT